jgi:hypothetical protein
MHRAFRLPPLFTSLDLLLIVGLGALVVSVYGYRWIKPVPPSQASGLQVSIQLEEEVVGLFDLNVDTVFTISGDLGPVELEIFDGSVYFKHSSCPQKICEKSGPIRKRGEVLVCAPNRLLARIKGAAFSNGSEKSLDSVTR